jgi:hypothetical protein
MAFAGGGDPVLSGRNRAFSEANDPAAICPVDGIDSDVPRASS